MVYQIVARSEWGAAPPRKPPLTLDEPALRVVFTYHTGALTCTNRDMCAQELRSIQANNFKRGMTDIAYNFLVGGQGEAYEGRGWGVLPSSQLKLKYGDRVDIAFIGNYSKETLPGRLFKASLNIISLGAKLGYIKRQWEICDIMKKYYEKKKPLPRGKGAKFKKNVENIDPFVKKINFADVNGEYKVTERKSRKLPNNFDFGKEEFKFGKENSNYSKHGQNFDDDRFDFDSDDFKSDKENLKIVKHDSTFSKEDVDLGNDNFKLGEITLKSRKEDFKLNKNDFKIEKKDDVDFVDDDDDDDDLDDDDGDHRFDEFIYDDENFEDDGNDDNVFDDDDDDDDADDDVDDDAGDDDDVNDNDDDESNDGGDNNDKWFN